MVRLPRKNSQPPEEEDTQSLGRVTLWQEQELAVLTHPATKKQLEMQKHLPPVESWDTIAHLPILNYQPDRAMRAAILEPHAWEKWKKDDTTTYWAYRYRMNSTHDLHVFLGGPRHPNAEEGAEIVDAFRVSMILTGRICLSIYITRRQDEKLTQTGNVLINLDEMVVAKKGMMR